MLRREFSYEASGVLSGVKVDNCGRRLEVERGKRMLITQPIQMSVHNLCGYVSLAIYIATYVRVEKLQMCGALMMYALDVPDNIRRLVSWFTNQNSGVGGN